MCYNVPLGKVPPRPNWMGFQGNAGENVGAHVLVLHGVAAREWLFITHSHHGPENGLSSLAVGPVMTTVGKDPCHSFLFFSASLWYLRLPVDSSPSRDQSGSSTRFLATV